MADTPKALTETKRNRYYRELSTEVEEEFKGLMARKNDLLLAEDVVEAAKAPQSTLHNFFTWDNEAAAQKYRLHEARNLIKTYELYIEDRNIRVRALTSLSGDRLAGGGYRWTMHVMAQAPLREELLRQAVRELDAVHRKFENLQELTSLWQSLETVKEENNIG